MGKYEIPFAHSEHYLRRKMWIICTLIIMMLCIDLASGIEPSLPPAVDIDIGHHDPPLSNLIDHTDFIEPIERGPAREAFDAWMFISFFVMILLTFLGILARAAQQTYFNTNDNHKYNHIGSDVTNIPMSISSSYNKNNNDKTHIDKNEQDVGNLDINDLTDLPDDSYTLQTSKDIRNNTYIAISSQQSQDDWTDFESDNDLHDLYPNQYKKQDYLHDL